MKLPGKVVSFLLFAVVCASDSNRKNCRYFVPVEAGVHALWASGLYFAWYSKESLTSFHFFNDMGEWQEMDKAGHIYSAFVLAELHYGIARGICKRTCLWQGILLSNITMLIMEIMDGFGRKWGFSIPDAGANLIGTGIWYLSKKVKDILFFPAFSYHEAPEWKYRPEILGNSLPHRIIKNYNGQTYWLVIGSRKWLAGISIGYNAYGMLGGRFNPSPYEYIERRRRILISIQPFLFNIHTKKSGVKLFMEALKYFKVPLPAIALDLQGKRAILVWYWLYW